MKTASGALNGKKVGIFGKGGSGKSTLTVLLAGALRNFDYEVCVLDADSSNVALYRALGLRESPRPLVEYFGGMVFGGGLVTCPVDDPNPLPGAEIQLEELPWRYRATTPDGIQFLVLGKMGRYGPGAGCDGPIAKIARDLRVYSAAGDLVTLVDFKAGLEDSARGVITGLDWVVLVVDQTAASVQMAIDMKDMVEKLVDGVMPATRHLDNPALVQMANLIYANAKVEGVSYVLNKISGATKEQYLRDRLLEACISPIGTIHDATAVSVGWLTGSKLNTESTREEVTTIAERLERAVRANQAPRLPDQRRSGHS